MADFGIGSAAGNEMIMRAGAGDYEGAQRTFRCAIRICGLVSIGVMIISIAVGIVCIWQHIPNTHFIMPDEVAMLIFLFGHGVCLSFFLGAISTGFRCCGKNAIELYIISNLSSLIQSLATALVLWLNFSPVIVCSTDLIVKLIFGIPQVLLLRIGLPRLS